MVKKFDDFVSQLTEDAKETSDQKVRKIKDSIDKEDDNNDKLKEKLKKARSDGDTETIKILNLKIERSELKMKLSKINAELIKLEK